MSDAGPVVSAGDRLLHVLRDRCAVAAREGGRLPPEPRLAEEVGVSRPLLREALSRLEHEGLVRRRRGEATAVNTLATDIRYWFDRQETYADRFERAGHTVRQAVIHAGFATASDTDVEQLGVDRSQWVITTRKRWWADDVVVAIADNIIPLPVGMTPEDVAEPAQNMFHLVAKLYGEDAEWEITRPRAIVADDALATQFGIESPAAVLALHTIGVSAASTRLYRAIEYYPPDGLDWAFVRTFRPE